MWNQYRISKTGLDGVLGSLERQIMAVVWHLGDATVTEAHEQLATDHSYDTIKTVMARLAEKGLLIRTLKGRAFVYQATLSQDELERQVSRQMIDSLISGFGSTALNQFADILKENPERLAEMRAILKRMAAEDSE